MNINKLEITRRIFQIATILTVVSCSLLGIITPFSYVQVERDFGTFTSWTWEAGFDIYLAIIFFLPVIFTLATNGSLKRYYKRRRAELKPQPRRSTIKTVSIAQGEQQLQQVGRIDIKFCIVCGQPNNAKGKFCSYCGTNL